MWQHTLLHEWTGMEWTATMLTFNFQLAMQWPFRLELRLNSQAPESQQRRSRRKFVTAVSEMQFGTFGGTNSYEPQQQERKREGE
jgi:hypothetical protein